MEVRNREFVVTPMYFYVISCKGTWLPGSRSGNLDAWFVVSPEILEWTATPAIRINAVRIQVTLHCILKKVLSVPIMTFFGILNNLPKGFIFSYFFLVFLLFYWHPKWVLKWAGHWHWIWKWKTSTILLFCLAFGKQGRWATKLRIIARKLMMW